MEGARAVLFDAGGGTYAAFFADLRISAKQIVGKHLLVCLAEAWLAEVDVGERPVRLATEVKDDGSVAV
jgi:hypothetical protein